MRHRVDEIGFSSPRGLEDRTNYAFRATSPRVEFTIEFEQPPGGATPAEQVVADEREVSTVYLEAGYGVDEEGERTLAGRPAKFIRFHFVEGGGTAQGYTLVGNLGSEANDADYVKLGWLIAGDAGSVPAIVDPLVASFAKAGDPPAVPTAPGSTRRVAGIWAFDLPDRFTGPRSFRWFDVDAGLQLSITVHPLGSDRPDAADWVDQTLAGRTLTLREDVPIIYGQLTRLTSTDPDGASMFACHVVQTYEFGRPVEQHHVEVEAAAPSEHESRLRQLIDALLAGIAVEAGR